MRKTFLTAAMLITSVSLFAQWNGNASTQYFTGTVGIGLSNPSSASKLHVSGNTLLENSSGRTLMIQRDNEDSWITFHDNDDMWYSMGIDYSDARKFKLNYGGVVGEQTHFVMTNTGNVGIGSSSPSNRLEVMTDFNAATTTTLFVGQNHNFAANTGYYGLGFQFEHVDGTSAGKLGHIVSWFANTPSKVMTFDYLGNVGIGTTSPDARLAVNGAVHAKEVRVDLNVPGPDYVFEPDYKLLSLEQIQQYIQQNKHLPEVPSAKEMEQNGISVSDMNMLLLKKVEELTLHVIELSNRNKALELRVAEIAEN